MKEARLTWSKERSQWIIRFWSETEREWLEDSAYFVKDVDPQTEIGWVSELLITRMYELQEMGYKVVLA